MNITFNKKYNQMNQKITLHINHLKRTTRTTTAKTRFSEDFGVVTLGGKLVGAALVLGLVTPVSKKVCLEHLK